MDKVSIKVLTKRGCKIHYKIRRILCLDLGIGAYCRFTFLNEVTYFYTKHNHTEIKRIFISVNNKNSIFIYT